MPVNPAPSGMPPPREEPPLHWSDGSACHQPNLIFDHDPAKQLPYPRRLPPEDPEAAFSGRHFMRDTYPHQNEDKGELRLQRTHQLNVVIGIHSDHSDDNALRREHEITIHDG